MVECRESRAGSQDARLVAGFRTPRRVSRGRQATSSKRGTADAIFGVGLLSTGLGGGHVVRSGVPDGRGGLAKDYVGGAHDPRELQVLAGDGRRLSAGTRALASQPRPAIRLRISVADKSRRPE